MEKDLIISKGFCYFLETIFENQKMFEMGSKQYQLQRKYLNMFKKSAIYLNGKNFEDTTSSELINFFAFLRRSDFGFDVVLLLLRRRNKKKRFSEKEWKEYRFKFIDCWYQLVKYIQQKIETNYTDLDEEIKRIEDYLERKYKSKMKKIIVN
jgi:hypothetical protein